MSDPVAALNPHLTVLVVEIDSVEAIPRLEAGELDLTFVRLDGELSSSIGTLSLLMIGPSCGASAGKTTSREIALVPSSMRKLVPENVVIRSLNERVMAVWI